LPIGDNVGEGMHIIIWPDFQSEVDGQGQIRHLIRKLQREKPPKLWAFVNATFIKIREKDDLADLVRQGWVERLGYVTESIWALRIPPGKLKGGVVRIYFAFDDYQAETTIALLAAEKKDTTSDDPEMIKKAIQRYREHCRIEEAEGKKKQSHEKTEAGATEKAKGEELSAQTRTVKKAEKSKSSKQKTTGKRKGR
jgi:hypothetical protein